jgi:hypothetical protein
MAPEQLAGEVVDARADQFSLCAAIWAALFGALPFPGDNVAAIAAAFLAGPVEPPKDARGVPPRIAAALRRGMALGRGERWPSVAALLVELRRAARRRWLGLAIAGAGLAVIAGLVAFFATTSNRPQPVRAAGAPAPLPFDPQRVELKPFLQWAFVEVRRKVPDAELARIHIDNVRGDGTADLTRSSRFHGLPAVLELRFASRARDGRADCMQSVRATAKKVQIDFEFGVCDEPVVPVPRCTPAAIRRLIAIRHPDIAPEELVNESYYAGLGLTAWFVDAAGYSERFDDLCQ